MTSCSNTVLPGLFFRDILSVSKKLATEREEMVNELQTLKQMVDTLHNNMQSDESRYVDLFNRYFPHSACLASTETLNPPSILFWNYF